MKLNVVCYNCIFCMNLNSSFCENEIKFNNCLQLQKNEIHKLNLNVFQFVQKVNLLYKISAFYVNLNFFPSTVGVKEAHLLSVHKCGRPSSDHQSQACQHSDNILGTI